MKVVVCYERVNGFMSACWRELSQRDGVELFVLGLQPNLDNYSTVYDEQIMDGLPHKLVDATELAAVQPVLDTVAAQHPDALIISGWQRKAYRELARDARVARARKIMMFDNPRKDTWKQLLGRFALRGHLDKMDFLFVPGERGWQLTRYWRVPEHKVRRGCLAADVAKFSGAMPMREALPGGWPQSFVFVGRYEREKGLLDLIEAYRRYRDAVSDPWPLRCCGVGSLKVELANRPGVEDLGFVQPANLPAVLAEQGVFILPSHWEPWGLAILEACASGLPIICTEACGSSVELVRSLYNGLTCATEDVDALVRAMRWCHAHHAQLPEMGRRSQDLARPYSAQVWADRVMSMLTSTP